MEINSIIDHTHATMNLPTLKSIQKQTQLEDNKDQEAASPTLFLKLPEHYQRKEGSSFISRNSHISGISTDCPSGVLPED